MSDQPFAVAPNLFPNVPLSPGVPSLFRLPGTGLDDTVQLVADAVSLVESIVFPQWGLYSDTGVPVLVADSIQSVSFQGEFSVPDFPIEQGSFQSYDKVTRPFDFKMTFMIGGSVAERAIFLAIAAQVVASMDLYVALTPEVAYPSVTATRWNYDRSNLHGAKLLAVDVWLKQIRDTGSAAFTNSTTQNPASTDPLQVGTLQGQTPPPGVAAQGPNGLLGRA